MMVICAPESMKALMAWPLISMLTYSMCTCSMAAAHTARHGSLPAHALGGRSSKDAPAVAACAHPPACPNTWALCPTKPPHLPKRLGAARPPHCPNTWALCPTKPPHLPKHLGAVLHGCLQVLIDVLLLDQLLNAPLHLRVKGICSRTMEPDRWNHCEDCRAIKVTPPHERPPALSGMRSPKALSALV
jgi:hypothetical protein